MHCYRPCLFQHLIDFTQELSYETTESQAQLAFLQPASQPFKICQGLFLYPRQVSQELGLYIVEVIHNTEHLLNLCCLRRCHVLFRSHPRYSGCRVNATPGLPSVSLRDQPLNRLSPRVEDA